MLLLELRVFVFYPITLEDHRGTTDELRTISFHLVLVSDELVELAKFIPVQYCFPISSSVYLFFYFPFTVPW